MLICTPDSRLVLHLYVTHQEVHIYERTFLCSHFTVNTLLLRVKINTREMFL